MSQSATGDRARKREPGADVRAAGAPKLGTSERVATQVGFVADVRRARVKSSRLEHSGLLSSCAATLSASPRRGTSHRAAIAGQPDRVTYQTVAFPFGTLRRLPLDERSPGSVRTRDWGRCCPRPWEVRGMFGRLSVGPRPSSDSRLTDSSNSWSAAMSRCWSPVRHHGGSRPSCGLAAPLRCHAGHEPAARQARRRRRHRGCTLPADGFHWYFGPGRHRASGVG